MSLQAILDTIRASGASQLRELEAQTDAQVRDILASANIEAQKLREEARAQAAAPAGAERARILHRAYLENLHIIGKVREELIKATLDQARGRLAHTRTDPAYPAILRRLVEECLAGLDCTPEESDAVRLEADPRDQSLLRKILNDMGLEPPVSYTLECWGGLVARSADGQVVVINTLESRLERATPYLRRFLAAIYENNSAAGEIPPQTGEEKIKQH